MVRFFITLFFLNIFICKISISQDFWQSNNGPSGGVIPVLAFDPSTLYIFAGTQSNGIYRSPDTNNSWEQINSGLTNINVRALVILPSGKILAGTFGGGIFISTDHGDLWTSGNSGLTNPFIYSLAISPNGYIFAGTGQKVFRSTDEGNSWSQISTGFPNATISSLAVNQDGYVFATTLGSGLYRTTNNGELWQLKDLGITNPDIKSVAVNSQGIVFAGTFNGVFRSTNNGDNWTRTDSGITTTGAVYGFTFNSVGNVFLCKFSGGVYRSTDNGDHWTQFNTGLPTMNIQTLTANTSGNIFAGTTGSGVYKSINTITGFHSSEIIANEFELSQNYPNPFNPVTIIKYELSISDFVSLKVFDVNGKEVRTLVNQKQSPGKYEIEFDGADLAGGVYFYQLDVNGIKQSHTMVLLK